MPSGLRLRLCESVHTVNVSGSNPPWTPHKKTEAPCVPVLNFLLRHYYLLEPGRSCTIKFSLLSFILFFFVSQSSVCRAALSQHYHTYLAFILDFLSAWPACFWITFSFFLHLYSLYEPVMAALNYLFLAVSFFNATFSLVLS